MSGCAERLQKGFAKHFQPPAPEPGVLEITDGHATGMSGGHGLHTAAGAHQPLLKTEVLGAGITGHQQVLHPASHFGGRVGRAHQFEAIRRVVRLFDEPQELAAPAVDRPWTDALDLFQRCRVRRWVSARNISW